MFADDATSAADLLRVAVGQMQQSTLSGAPGSGSVSSDSAPASINLPRPAARRRQARPERPGATRVPTTTSGQGPSVVEAIGSIVRMAIFFGVLYGVISLWSVPEVRDVVVSVVRGESPDWQPLLAKLAEWLNP